MGIKKHFGMLRSKLYNTKVLNMYCGIYKLGYPKQLSLIHATNWDVLILLDACRYDFFSQEYEQFLNGKLTKVWSPASDTFRWLKTVFPAQYELTYVSATPVVNSKNIPVQGYNAKTHFRYIVDVWDSGWSEKLGTVPPWNVNEESMENLDDRMIIHYIQPHSPYIGATKLIGLPKPLPEIDPLQVDDGTWIGADKWIIEGVKQGRTSVQELKLAYRENLKLCLSYIAKLTSELPHNHIIVTSDHGELLGECGFFMHPPKINTPNLRCIPWLELRNGGE